MRILIFPFGSIHMCILIRNIFHSAVLSLVITSLSVFLIWAITNYAAVVGVASLFSGCMLVVFGTITLIVANVYEPGVRYV